MTAETSSAELNFSPPSGPRKCESPLGPAQNLETPGISRYCDDLEAIASIVSQPPGGPCPARRSLVGSQRVRETFSEYLEVSYCRLRRIGSGFRGNWRHLLPSG
jgi:hypothetical protein